MDHVIRHEGSFPVLEVRLAPSETIFAESGSMVAHAGTVTMTIAPNARRGSGLWGQVKALALALVRRIFGQRTMFLGRFDAPSGGWVWLAPAAGGSIRHIPMRGERLVLGRDSYLAHSGDVDLALRWSGRSGMLAGEGELFYEASGEGELWLCSYGAIEAIDVVGVHVVDSGHLVAFDRSLELDFGLSRGGASEILGSGEGVVSKLVGSGRAYMQTRKTRALVGWLARLWY
jgi:uncharacterized protein (TIGR00266 family)